MGKETREFPCFPSACQNSLDFETVQFSSRNYQKEKYVWLRTAELISHDPLLPKGSTPLIVRHAKTIESTKDQPIVTIDFILPKSRANTVYFRSGGTPRKQVILHKKKSLKERIKFFHLSLHLRFRENRVWKIIKLLLKKTSMTLEKCPPPPRNDLWEKQRLQDIGHRFNTIQTMNEIFFVSVQ